MCESDGGWREENRQWEHDCPDCEKPLRACDGCGRPYCSLCQQHTIEDGTVAESHSASDVASALGTLSNPADETGLRFGKIFEEEYQEYWYRRERGGFDGYGSMKHTYFPKRVFSRRVAYRLRDEGIYSTERVAHAVRLFSAFLAADIRGLMPPTRHRWHGDKAERRLRKSEIFALPKTQRVFEDSASSEERSSTGSRPERSEAPQAAGRSPATQADDITETRRVSVSSQIPMESGGTVIYGKPDLRRAGNPALIEFKTTPIDEYARIQATVMAWVFDAPVRLAGAETDDTGWVDVQTERIEPDRTPIERYLRSTDGNE